MGNDSKAKTQIKRIAFLNCHTAKLFTADVDMSESECVSAWKKDPSGGVIGVQKGPLC
jgi:hypothetical protein